MQLRREAWHMQEAKPTQSIVQKQHVQKPGAATVIVASTLCCLCSLQILSKRLRKHQQQFGKPIIIYDDNKIRRYKHHMNSLQKGFSTNWYVGDNAKFKCHWYASSSETVTAGIYSEIGGRFLYTWLLVFIWELSLHAWIHNNYIMIISQVVLHGATIVTLYMTY